MPASLSNKFQSLSAQITCLRAQQQALLQERESDITRLVVDLNLALLDDTILTGLFLFAAEKRASSDPILEIWREKGERFRRASRKAKLHPSQKTATPHTPHQPLDSPESTGENGHG